MLNKLVRLAHIYDMYILRVAGVSVAVLLDFERTHTHRNDVRCPSLHGLVLHVTDIWGRRDTSTRMIQSSLEKGHSRV